MNNETRHKRTIIIIASAILLILAGVIAWQVYNALQAPKPNPNLTNTNSHKDTQTTTAPTGSDSSTNNNQPSPSTPDPSSDQVTKIITDKNPSLLDANGQPNFNVVKIIRPIPGWYVATVKQEAGSVEQAKAIFKSNSDGTISLVAGPGTSFPSEYIVLPSEVRKALSQ